MFIRSLLVSLCSLGSVVAQAGTPQPSTYPNPQWNDYAEIDWTDATGAVVTTRVLPTRRVYSLPSAPAESSPATFVGGELQSILDDVAIGTLPDVPVAVVARVRDDGTLVQNSPKALLQQAWADGVVTSETEEDVFLQAKLAARRPLVADLVGDALALTTTAVTRNLRRLPNSPVVIFDVKPSELQVIINDDIFQLIDLDAPFTTTDADGVVLQSGLDMDVFFDFNGDGVERGTGDFDGAGPHLVGQVEGEIATPTHPGQEDGSGADRVGSPLECIRGLGCGTPGITAPTGGHANTVMSAFLGDLTLGQDPAISTAAERQRRSHVARGATLRPFRAYKRSDVLEFIDAQIANLGTADELQLMIHTNGWGSLCETTTALVAGYNDLFEEASVLTFKTAGNNGDSDPAVCDVPDPAPAAGAFVVGATNDIGLLRSQPRSGDATRSIVDGVVYGNLSFTYEDPAIYLYQGGTSISTPIMAGVAAVYMDYYVGKISSRIRDPGWLKANLLMMGDRAATAGGTVGSGFDSQFGAGRVVSRTWHPAGGDLAPQGRWMSGRVCIDRGEEDVIEHPQPSSGRAVDAVAFWLDRRMEKDKTANNVDLEVGYVDSSGVFQVLAADAGLSEEKERAFFQQSNRPGTRSYAVRLTGGEAIRGRDPVCGYRSEQVWFAFRVEDVL